MKTAKLYPVNWTLTKVRQTDTSPYDGQEKLAEPQSVYRLQDRKVSAELPSAKRFIALGTEGGTAPAYQFH